MLHSRATRDQDSWEVNEERRQLFMLMLRLGIAPQHGELKPRIERILDALLKGLLNDDVETERILHARIETLLRDVEAPTTRLAILSIMPSSTLRSRSIQRRLAYYGLTRSQSKDTSINGNDYNCLANVLSSKSAAINPILETNGRDYLQIDANVQLLYFAFTDFALQLLVTVEDSSGIESRRSVKKALSKVIQNYHDYDEDSATFLRLLLPSSSTTNSNGEEPSWKVNMSQVKGVHQIMEALQSRSSQIQDGKGAFLDRSSVKDQLQRLRLMLQYQLNEFGLIAGSETSQQQQNLQQGKLSKWFK